MALARLLRFLKDILRPAKCLLHYCLLSFKYSSAHEYGVIKLSNIYFIPRIAMVTWGLAGRALSSMVSVRLADNNNSRLEDPNPLSLLFHELKHERFYETKRNSASFLFCEGGGIPTKYPSLSSSEE